MSSVSPCFSFAAGLSYLDISLISVVLRQSDSHVGSDQFRIDDGSFSFFKSNPLEYHHADASSGTAMYPWSILDAFPGNGLLPDRFRLVYLAYAQ